MPSGKQVHDMSDEVLLEHLANTRQELFGLRFQHATGELDSTARLRMTKRDLARALTVARERGLDTNQPIED